MTVSKRTRFEILRRDNHTCRYCGGMAPDVTLHVDHVVPVSLGGSDEPSNLIAACKDCNTGKASTSPSETIVAEVSDKAVALAEAFRVALAAQAKNLRAQNEYQRQFRNAWTAWTSGGAAIELPVDWTETVAHWFRVGVPFEIVENAIDVAMAKRGIRTRDGEFRYMCGVVWRTLENAQKSLEAPAVPDAEIPGVTIVPCMHDWCGSPALRDAEDEDEAQCAGCEGAAQWQQGEHYAAQSAASRDLVAMHIDGMRSGFGERVRWVA